MHLCVFQIIIVKAMKSETTTLLTICVVLVSSLSPHLEIQICSKLIRNSAKYPEIALELYEDFLAAMFRNSSANIWKDGRIPAKSTLMENADYFASADILDTLEFFVQTLPYLSHQYDERDLILYISSQNADQINIYRNWQMSPEKGYIRIKKTFCISKKETIFQDYAINWPFQNMTLVVNKT